MVPIVRADADGQSATRRWRGIAFVLRGWQQDPKRLLYVLSFAAIAILLAARPIGLALDDFSYLDYLDGADWFQFIDYVQLRGFPLIIEEPLWQLLIHLLSSFLDSETAFRLIILSSVLMYSWAFRNAPSSALLFALFAFVACPSMLSQAYFNQVRQGFANSILIVFLSLGEWGYVAGAAVAGLVHTAQLSLLPIYCKGKKGFAILAVAVLIGGAAIAAGIFESFLQNLDLGRREYYAFDSQLNYRFYIVTVPLYFGILGFVWYEHVRLKQTPEPILFQTIIFCMVAIAVSLEFEAGGRLFYLLDVLVVWTLCRFWKGRVPLGAWLWACAQLGLGFYLSAIQDFEPQTTWGRYGTIFSCWW